MTPQTPFGAAAERSELLSRSEAAAYLGIAKQTLAIWKCTKRYKLPYVKIGKLVKYRLYRSRHSTERLISTSLLLTI